ncbi:MAG: hypothetical protein ACM3N9_04635 [Syntrophothermus sp.]
MPLRKGKSNETISGNIKEMMEDYEKKGKIGNSKPESKQKAQKQAAAIAYKKAGRSRNK